MFRYEILVLTIPEITKDETSTLEFQIDKLIRKISGSIISFERWGKYRLAYPVKKNDYGVYFLIRFEVEEKQSIVEDLNTLFAVKFSGIVMRSLVSKLDDNRSLEYEKPPSLEDTPKRHISSFLEEKGLLRTKRTKKVDLSESGEIKPKKEEKVDDSVDESRSSKEAEEVKASEDKSVEKEDKKEPVSEETKEA